MSWTEQVAVAVRILRSPMEPPERQTLPDGNTAQPRSRLYGLAPREVGSVWAESLTSYINRLGWRHGVAPWRLIEQEVVPVLAPEWRSKLASRRHLSRFTANAMGLNGSGNPAAIWLTALSQLTMRSDLPLLTSLWRIGDLPSAGNLRLSPVWCPVCYMEWKEQDVPIYQPLLWMLQVMVICPRHKRRLIERCPFCQRTQAIFTSDKTHPGECTRCTRWLGTEAEPQAEQGLDEELIAWQEWVVKVLQDLQIVSASSGAIHWEAFFMHLAVGMKERGSFSRLARLTGINREVLHHWVSGAVTPSFEMILKFCYICDTTPLQIMESQFTPLQHVIQSETPSHAFRHHRASRHRVDYEYCLEVLQAVCDGREDPVPSIHQLAKRLGCEVHALTRHFPQECAFITEVAQKHRQQRQEQRLAQVREQVRQVVMSLHSQGIYPSHRKLRSILSSGLMRMPEAHTAWHAALHDLGLEQ